MQELVILVDKFDNPIGTMEKLEAHQKGLLHRAFSVFIFNSKHELLLQKRALNKYHSAGLWTNTCCSHPRVNEDNLAAANRRLLEEMGLSCQLAYAFNFLYKSKLEEGLIEHEFDHVFVGYSDEIPKINLSEVADYQYITIENLKEDIKLNPLNYTTWFKICLNQVIEQITVK